MGKHLLPRRENKYEKVAKIIPAISFHSMKMRSTRKNLLPLREQMLSVSVTSQAPAGLGVGGGRGGVSGERAANC